MTSALFAHLLLWFGKHFVDTFADISRASSTALIAAIWQGILLAAIAALTLRLIPRIPAAARFAVWFFVFSLIAALPILQLAPRSLSSPSTHALLNLNRSWTFAIAAVWFAASLLRAVTLVAAALRVRTLARNATPVALGLAPASAARRARVCTSTDIDRPTVIGFLSPRILVPAWLLDKLTPAELDHIVLHESTHLRRADDWLNLLQKLALVLFPLNPALAWIERRLCFERELACDEHVLAALASRSSESAQAAANYASSLANLAGYRLARRSLTRNLALALGALGTSARESELGRRVARILRPATGMKPLHARLAAATAIAVLLFATTQLERTPQLVSFTTPAPAAQLADLTTPAPGAPSYAPGVPGERSLLAGVGQRNVGSSEELGLHVLAGRVNVSPVHAVRAISRTRLVAARHLVAARSPQLQQGSLILTRFTVFQSPNGYRVVRTSAILSTAPTPQNKIRSDFDPAPNTSGAPSRLRLGRFESSTSDSPAPDPTTPRTHEILQPVPPYAAVPVPGGWLLFQL